jgi:hypothetical protein
LLSVLVNSKIIFIVYGYYLHLKGATAFNTMTFNRKTLDIRQ